MIVATIAIIDITSARVALVFARRASRVSSHAASFAEIAIALCRNVKHWRDAPMALRWTGAAMREATKGFRRLKAHKQLPVLRQALAALEEHSSDDIVLAPDTVAA
jgi:hypothetical protein